VFVNNWHTLSFYLKFGFWKVLELRVDQFYFLGVQYMENISSELPNKNSTVVIDKNNSVQVTELSVKAKDLDKITVVKRNGMLVPFRKDRIFRAIEGAWRATNKIDVTDPLSPEAHRSIQQVTEEVVREAYKLALKGACLTVEGIQDVVEARLMENGHYEVAKNYIIYRNEQKVLREDSPQNLKILRRDGIKFVRFNPMKIASAIEKAFRASRGVDGQTPQDIIDAVNLLTNKIVRRATEISKAGTTLNVEMIQDEIERQMMSEGFYQEAKDFIIYRAERTKLRALSDSSEHARAEVVTSEEVNDDTSRSFRVTLKDGSFSTITESEIQKRIQQACLNLDNVDPKVVLEDSIRNFYEGIREDEVDQANIMAARIKVEHEPDYTKVTARILLDVIYRETMGIPAYDKNVNTKHAEYFTKYIDRGIQLGRISNELKKFDLTKLSKALKLERDLEFAYLGLQTLYDRYLIHENERRLETPQIFWMRVAMGLALREGKEMNERAIEFYDILSQFYFVSSTPTLFNSGTCHSQMSSCYLSTVMDDLSHIFKVVSDDAQLSKWAGGLGNDWSNVRATGSRIKGTNGKSQGVIPFLKVANDTAVAVNQGGKRKGAMCAYLETWHLDLEDFLELRKNTGDDRRRTHDMNTANWIPDLFMKRVSANGSWTMFSPSDVPDLHDLYGSAFEKRYEEYERMVDEGKIKLFKRVEAVGLWRKMLSMLFETGHPWITFKDPSNLRSPQDHCGVVHSSNLCTEILLNTSADETAVCNLGSINLAKHVTAKGLDVKLLEKTVTVAIRMLDNVIDINFYPTKEAENANLKHRPVGLGLMGFQDALYIQDISYASPEAVEFSDRSMEAISYYAILASTKLAKERGTYSSYKGSKWDKGLLPIDTIQVLAKERGAEHLDVDTSVTMDWEVVRKAVKENGMRNSNTMAIAPTATIANITGITQSIEPTYKHLYAKSNLSGEFIVTNTYLVDKLKELGLWDSDMLDDLKYFDGSLMEIERIPDEVKRVYLTSFEIEPEWIIECGSRRQKWIDMGQSLNLYISQPSGKKLHDMYMFAWKKGLKTTYYLRSLAATQIEKSTTDVNRRGLQPRWMKSKSASSDIKVERAESAEMPKAMACSLDGDCESCQ
jgi:ribonucleoside-diphosphate reductase alpha chain